MSVFERMKTIFDAVDAEMHKINIPVSNTGVFFNDGTLDDETEERFDQIGNVNFKGVVF
jgi:NAD(P)-dependent dehydrogenase (short-subunit alcohol dehydrogenase family)